MAHKDASDADDGQGRLLGMPYDLRHPTWSRLTSRWWNPADRRFFTPETFGVGYDVNLCRVTHPFSKPKR
jgi:hypothetical protein